MTHQQVQFEKPAQASSRAEVEDQDQFTTDELHELDYALANLIQDKADYCANEDGTAEHIERLEALRAKVASLISLSL
jgi:endonuclease/exonuclease/phosphatase (EEP) superfamily protein YafD|nr:hypothetical protein [uncultured bacterium]BCT98888.1 hypothetical protein [uncultured bacterium]BCT99289.1 KleA protein [uncultured bacterium]BCU00671.1 hypothetical protein [uncultured bacterium]BCU01184.1 KleA protein [uncultured bacterium]